MRKMMCLLLGLLAAGCGSRTGLEMTRFHEDGRAKPIVLVPQVIDTSSFDASWSLSDELTTQLVDQLGSGGFIFVAKADDVAFTENPFSRDISWMKREFTNQEFVVFLELVEHEIVPADPSKKDLAPQENSYLLNSSVRMRVVDLRTTPKIVLQETVRNSHFIPQKLIPTNYGIVTWGTEEYQFSEMKIAHDELVAEISARVTDYILLAKSR